MNIRFAKIENELDDKNLAKFLEGIKKYSLRGKRPMRKGFMNPQKMKEGILFRFYKDVKNTAKILDNTNTEMTEEGYLCGEFKIIFVFKEGYMAYQRPTKGKSSSIEIFYLLKKIWSNYVDKKELKIKRIDEFPYKSLKNFYKEAKEISFLKLIDIGKTKPNPHWPEAWMKEVVENLGKDVDTLGLSTGKKKKGDKRNLKRPKMIKEGLIPISKPIQIKGKLQDNEFFSIDINGSLRSSMPEKDENAKINKFIRVCKKVVEGFFESNEG